MYLETIQLRRSFEAGMLLLVVDQPIHGFGAIAALGWGEEGGLEGCGNLVVEVWAGHGDRELWL